ncbi:MAG: hypothetical protein ACUVRS_07575 [Armatimonadota bacterium]
MTVLGVRAILLTVYELRKLVGILDDFVSSGIGMERRSATSRAIISDAACVHYVKLLLSGVNFRLLHLGRFPKSSHLPLAGGLNANLG